jgi:catechol 2,3-dioxygenase-like lactoylglutathione lyase family enzyme
VAHPKLLHTVLDTPDVRGLAEFYRQLLDLRYRPGDEPPSDGVDDADWLVLTDEYGVRKLAFQLADHHQATTWPEPGVPQQLHLDMTVPSIEALAEVRALAESLGATVRYDRTDHEEEPLYVFADPSGHTFCTFVA